MYYCEIIAPGAPGESSRFFRGQGSSKRVAAQRAIAKLMEEATPGAFSKGEGLIVNAGRIR
jgi:hypothetical protein